VVEHGQPVREIDGVVERQEGHAGPELHAPGQRERLGEEQVGGRRVLPALRQVFADPGLAKPEPVGQHDLVDVPLVAIGEGAMGRVQRHHEQTELHARF